MSVFLDDIGNWLTTQGVCGGSSGWELSQGTSVDEPDQLITIYETAGEPPDIQSSLVGQVNSGEVEYDAPGLQVKVRGAVSDYATPRAQMQLVFQALHENEPPNSSGSNMFVYIYAVNSSPISMGRDESNRYEFVLNFRTKRQR